MRYAAKMKLAEYLNIMRDQPAWYECFQTQGFAFRKGIRCSLLIVFQKPLVWTMSNSSDWNKWFDKVGVTIYVLSLLKLTYFLSSIQSLMDQTLALF